ncbi:monooxygenase [Nitzschia inconspicua]|uniref:Monooxygenase n=1 Tax=Nitzschia inconspicua TaxID=303405 RepID=A0A9K3PDI4_9STRA|nr:monooxygenase [Nitzschia inconspicua]
MRTALLCFSLLVFILLVVSDAFIPWYQQLRSVVTVNQGLVQAGPKSAISTSLFSTTEETSSTPTDSSSSTETNDRGLLKRDRYVATNRFAVRSGKEAKFEQRWATRKSRLAELDGFKYFHLMRRVKLQDDDSNSNDDKKTVVYDGGTDKESRQGNYVSFTIWQRKSDFSAWRKGDAFKEAHGGTSIGAFLSTMVNSALVLQGPPRPAFYDGLLVQSLPPKEIPETVDGWRNMVEVADGVNTLPTECFVACNQFYVPQENAAAFEQRWAQRESKLKDCEGFVAFTMMRRDGQQKGHGTVPMDENEPTYVSTTIWKDKASFDKWRSGSAFSQAHGQQSSSGGGGPPASGAQPLWSRPPQPVFYEGTLVITKEEGA